MASDYLLRLDGIPGESKGRLNGLPISDFTSVPAASILGCNTGNINTVCDGLTFQTLSNPLFDAIIFRFTDVAGGNPGSTTYLFANGSFNSFGSYTSVNGDAFFTLSAVPEAATWLSLILGFGLVGMVLRRRRLRAA